MQCWIVTASKGAKVSKYYEKPAGRVLDIFRHLQQYPPTASSTATSKFGGKPEYNDLVAALLTIACLLEEWLDSPRQS